MRKNLFCIILVLCVMFWFKSTSFAEIIYEPDDELFHSITNTDPDVDYGWIEEHTFIWVKHPRKDVYFQQCNKCGTKNNIIDAVKVGSLYYVKSREFPEPVYDEEDDQDAEFEKQHEAGDQQTISHDIYNANAKYKKTKKCSFGSWDKKHRTKCKFCGNVFREQNHTVDKIEIDGISEPAYVAKWTSISTVHGITLNTKTVNGICQAMREAYYDYNYPYPYIRYISKIKSIVATSVPSNCIRNYSFNKKTDRVSFTLTRKCKVVYKVTFESGAIYKQTVTYQ